MALVRDGCGLVAIEGEGAAVVMVVGLVNDGYGYGEALIWDDFCGCGARWLWLWGMVVTVVTDGYGCGERWLWVW